MMQMIEANWIAFVIALLIGLLVAWWVFARGSTVASPRERKPDALDEGAAPAARNQALIDSPPAADLVPGAATGLMAGVGEVVSVAAQDEVEEAAVREAEAAGQAPPAPEPDAEGDDLRRIKGVGPKLVTLLNSLGVTRFEQIANWTEEDLARVDAELGAFEGRPQRDSWIEQAKLLSSGDTAAYEAKFGKL
ncbi:MAG: hypothetical protein R3D89_04425 [Sphingomonadaceae bacterium]|jgi:predicted flap endonuclease-1-like 5' DNA nuclease